MAALTLVSVWRPQVIDANDVNIDAGWLVVDLVETGTSVPVTATLAFDAYPGLEAEWNAGTATTVLDTAIEMWITGGTVQTSNPDTPSGGGDGSKGTEYPTSG